MTFTDADAAHAWAAHLKYDLGELRKLPLGVAAQLLGHRTTEGRSMPIPAYVLRTLAELERADPQPRVWSTPVALTEEQAAAIRAILGQAPPTRPEPPEDAHEWGLDDWRAWAASQPEPFVAEVGNPHWRPQPGSVTDTGPSRFDVRCPVRLGNLAGAQCLDHQGHLGDHQYPQPEQETRA